MTFEEMIARTRVLLDEPEPQRPNPRTINQHLLSNAQLLYTQMANSSVDYEVYSWDLTTSPGVDTYIIAAANFGKEVLLHTISPDDPFFVERQIQIIPLQSSLTTYAGPKQVTAGNGLTGSFHTAVSASFFREGTTVKILLRPTPGESVQYRIWYSTDVPDLSSTANTFPLPASHPYLCIKTAIACLPHCEWGGMTKEDWAAKRRELALSLTKQEQEHNDAFRRLVANDRKMGTTTRRGFGDGWDREGFGVGWSDDFYY